MKIDGLPSQTVLTKMFVLELKTTLTFYLQIHIFLRKREIERKRKSEK